MVIKGGFEDPEWLSDGSFVDLSSLCICPQSLGQMYAT